MPSLLFKVLEQNGDSAVLVKDGLVIPGPVFKSLYPDTVVDTLFLKRSGTVGQTALETAEAKTVHLDVSSKTGDEGSVYVFSPVGDVSRRKKFFSMARRFFHKSPKPIILVNRDDGRIIRSNPAASHLYGQDPSGTPFLSEGDGPPSSEPSLFSLERGGKKTIVAAFTVILEDGLDLVMLEDITQAVSTREQLAKDREMMQSIMDTVPSLVCWKDCHGRLVGANRHYMEMAGGKGKSPWSPCLETLRLEKEEMDVALTGKKKTNMEMTLKKNGETTTWLVSMAPLPSLAGNESVGVVTLFTDITERKMMLDRLEAESLRAEEASRAKSMFLANMSHEIRTPLNGIIGFSDLLAEEPLSDTQAKEVEMIRRCSDSLLEIINDILDISKIESGKMDIRPEPCSPTSICSEVVKVFGNGRLRLDTSRATDDRFVMDGVRLKQVMTNLVSNAIKFSESGDIVVRVSRSGKGLRFTVADHGPGIPSEQAKSVFDPFVQADSTMSKRHAGTGLGLSISARLVSLMGGAMRLKSVPGRGSVFSFVLFPPPACEHDSDSQEKGTADRLPDGFNVMIVDDNEINIMLAEELVKDLGGIPLSAPCGEACLSMLRAGAKPDVILLDIRMPGIDGFETSRIIRKEGLVPDTVPIVAATAHAFDEERDRCLKTIGNFHPKPFRKESFDAFLVALSRRD